MHFGVTLATKALQVRGVVRAAIFNFNDVMHLQFNGRTESLKVVFGAKALPAVITAPSG